MKKVKNSPARFVVVDISEIIWIVIGCFRVFLSSSISRFLEGSSVSFSEGGLRAPSDHADVRCVVRSSKVSSHS